MAIVKGFIAVVFIPTIKRTPQDIVNFDAPGGLEKVAPLTQHPLTPSRLHKVWNR